MSRTDSCLALQIRKHVREGSIVPVEITCRLISNVRAQTFGKSSCCSFLFGYLEVISEAEILMFQNVRCYNFCHFSLGNGKNGKLHW